MDAPTPSLDELLRRLERARRRVSSATPGGPEWDAAMDEVEELIALIAAAEEQRLRPASLLVGSAA